MLTLAPGKYATRLCIVGKVIKSPKRSLGNYSLSPFLLLIIIFLLPFPFLFLSDFFFPPKFRPGEFSITTRLIVLKFEDMVDMDVKLCNKVSKSKMLESKAGPWACQKTT